MIDEYVSALKPSGERAIIRKSRAQRAGWSYRLLPAQPLTAAERREQDRFREEVATRRLVVEKLFGKRGDSEERGLGGGKVHLSQKERVAIERLIGVPVEDAQDARRKMKERGFRHLERGEETDQRLKAQAEWAAAGGEKAGVPLPEAAGFPGWDKLGMMKTPEPFDFEESYARNREKYGE